MAKNAVPARMKKRHKKEYKFIDMPKDKLIRLCVIVGVIILAIVLFFVLRSAFDGHLAVKDGKVVTGGDNWIIANTGTTASPRYFKLGTALPVEGYDLGLSDQLTGGDVNRPIYAYTPSAQDGSGFETTVNVGNGEYDQLSKTVWQNTTAYLTNAVMGDMVTEKIGEQDVCYFPYTYSLPQTNEDGTAGDEVFYRNVNAYIKAGRGRSIVLHLNAQAASQEELPAQETMIQALPALVGGVSVEP